MKNGVILDQHGRPINISEYDDGQAIPHVMTFSSIVSGAWRTYFHGGQDEALRASRENAHASLRDPHIMALVQERLNPVRGRNWDIIVEDERDPWQKAVKVGVTRIVNRIPFFRQMISYLQKEVWYGKYASAVRWEWDRVRLPDHKGDEKLMPALCVAEHRPVHGDKIGFHFDGTPYIQVYNASDIHLGYSLARSTESTAVPLTGALRQQFIIARHEVEDADYYKPEEGASIGGVGLRSMLYWAIWLKQEYLAWITSFLEKVGLGIVIIEYEAGNSTSEAAADDAIKRLRKTSVIKLPVTGDKTWSSGGIRVIEAPMSGATLVMALIEYFDRPIERLVVGQTMSGGTDQTSGIGGTGKAMLAKDTKYRIVNWDAIRLGEHITGNKNWPGLISTIVRWTWPGVDFPVKFAFKQEETDMERVGMLLDAARGGVRIDEDDIRGPLGARTPPAGSPYIGGHEQGMTEMTKGVMGMPSKGSAKAARKKTNPAFQRSANGKPA